MLELRRLIVNWEKLGRVHASARAAGVGYSMNYCEADDSWYFSVHSAAPSEEWIGKNYSFDIAVECVLEWMNKLSSNA